MMTSENGALLRIGLIKTDYVNQELIFEHGDLPDMFASFFQGNNLYEFTVFEARFEEFPEKIHEFDALILTGSRYSVNDDQKWIEVLKLKILDCQNKIPIVGICFGHQLLATALGGVVERRDAGPNVGTQKIQIHHLEAWMSGSEVNVELLFNHGEEVTVLPDEAKILASSETCKSTLVLYRPNILGIQAHPEYTPEYQNALMSINSNLSQEAFEDALQRNLSLERQEERIRSWIVNFITRNLNRK